MARSLPLVLLLCVLLAGCARTDLLQGLEERQANEVVAVLLHHNIEAEKRSQGKAGYLVQVSEADLAEAIDIVQMKGLPSQPRTQVAALFPPDSMVSTPLAERARLLSAIEQRLEESLSTLDGVSSARVHVSYDAGPAEGSLQQRKPPSMHVAAVLAHDAEADTQALQVVSKRFLRNAFVDVAYDNVSVVLTPASAVRTLSVTPTTGSAWNAWTLLLPLTALVILGAGMAWLLRSRHPEAARLRARLPARSKELGHAGER